MKGAGQVDDVITEGGGTHSLKTHNERAGLIYRSAPVTKEINKETLEPTLSTTSFSSTLVAGGDFTWVGLRCIGSGGTDMVMDNMVVRDLGPSANQPGCATISAADLLALSPQVPAEIVTTFTNTEDAAADNVELSLGTAPAGWTFLVNEENGNLFDSVAPGANVSTTWVVVPAANAGGTTTALPATAVYFNANATKHVSERLSIPVQSTGMVPLDKLKVTTGPE